MSGDGGPLSSASFNYPTHMAYDPSGFLYITDFSNNEIRSINMTTLTISSLIGNGVASSTGNGGLANQATTFRPYGIVLDASKNIFFSELSGNIRKIDTTGNVNLVQNIGSSSNYGLAFDISKNLLIGASGSIYKLSLDSSGAISSQSAKTTYSHAVGQAYGVSVDPFGNIWLAGKSGGMQKLSATGSSLLTYSTTGTAPLGLSFSTLIPSYVYPLSNGNILVVSYSGYILKITPGSDTQYGMQTGSSTTAIATVLAGTPGTPGNTLGNVSNVTTLFDPTFLLFIGNDGYIPEDVPSNILKIANFISVTQDPGSYSFALPATLSSTTIPSGCLFNLDATQNITYNGSNVITSWTDTVNSISVNIIGSPTYSATGLNNKPGIYFAQSNAANYAQINTGALANKTLSGMTMFVVMYAANYISNGSTSYNWIFSSNAAWGTTGWVGFAPQWLYTWTPNTTTQPSVLPTNATPVILTFTGSSNYYTYRYNGVTQIITSVNTGIYQYYLYALNLGYYNQTWISGLNGYIGQMTCFNRVLSVAEINNMEAYLSYKWQIPLKPTVNSTAVIVKSPILTLSSITPTYGTVNTSNQTITGALTSSVLPSGCLFNYDASYNVTFNASTKVLTSWVNTVDNSGVTVINSPVYSATAINGKPGISFPLGCLVSTPALSSTAFTSGITTFFVVYSTNYTANNWLYYAESGAISLAMSSFNTTSFISNNTAYILSTTITPNGLAIYRANGIGVSASNFGTLAAFTKLDIGGAYNNSSFYFGGYIGQALVFNNVLSIATIQSIESYLSYKWQIPIGYPSTSKISTSNTISTTTVTSYSISPINYNPGGTFTITAPVSTSPGAFTYTSSNSAVATIAGSVVSIIGGGTTTITASQAATSTYTTGTVTGTLTINPIAPTIVSGSFVANNPTLSSNQIYNTTYTVIDPSSNSTGAFTYAVTSGSTYASISGRIITMIQAGGTATVTATQASTASYNSATFTFTFTVVQATPVVTFSIPTQYYATPYTLSSTSTSPGAITYSIDNTAVATISGTTMTMTGVGTTNVTLTQVATTNYTSYTTSVSLTVLQGTPTNTFSIPQYQTVGIPYNIVNVTTNSPGSFTYTSGNTSIATVSGTTITMIAPGTVIITETQSATTNFTSATLTATIKVNPVPTFGSFVIPVSQTIGIPYTFVDPSSNSAGAFSYVSSNTAIASISGRIITMLTAGQVTITGTQAITTTYGVGTFTSTFNVYPAPTITNFTIPAYQYGVTSSFTLVDPSSNSTGVFSYTSNNLGIATISGHTVTVVGPGIANSTATQASDNANYGAASATAQLTITTTATLGALTVNSGNPLAYGTTYTITNPTSNNSGGAFSYTSSNTSIFNVSGNTITPTGIGSANLTATQAAYSYYLSTTGSPLSVTVNQGIPTIQHLFLPTNLTSGQTYTIVDPSSNSTGAFTYSSNNSAVASISGNIFTYNGGFGSTTITINQAASTYYTALSVTATYTIVASGSGGTITPNGNYNIHTFTTTGTSTFTIPSSRTVNYLLVAAGGGGGANSAGLRTNGGGGAGGYKLGSTTLTANSYSVVVGTGGALTTNGGNTTFNSIIALGGGAGGGTGQSGGSGGGGSHNGSSGAGTSGQGFAGGPSVYDSQSGTGSFSAAGGGGAISLGGSGTLSTYGGTGGTGLTVTSSNLPGYNTTTIVCGGGGGGYQDSGNYTTLVNGNYPGGKGGSGGGGNGGYSCVTVSKYGAGTNGTANTGGGGGGGADNGTISYQSGTGGSGIVIFTYLASSITYSY